MKYLALRTLLASKGFDWLSNTIVAVALNNYTFDESHESLSEMEIAGATVLSSVRVTSKSITNDGWAESRSVTLPVVPQGGPYTLVLFMDSTGRSSGMYPLVAYTGASGITTLTNGDVIVRPEDALDDGVGRWFRF